MPLPELRYGWQLPNVPNMTLCVCGKNLSVDHAFTWPTGRLPMLRHNNIRDLTADRMAMFALAEPELQPLSVEALAAKKIC